MDQNKPKTREELVEENATALLNTLLEDDGSEQPAADKADKGQKPAPAPAK